MAENKQCSRCQNLLPLSSFNNCKKGTFGKQGYCQECQKVVTQKHYRANKSHRIEQRLEWRKTNRQKDRSSCARWRHNNPESYQRSWKNYNQKYRQQVLSIVGRGQLRCVRCGCDRIELLEINHVNGGGHKEVKRRNQHFYCAIISGKRAIDDLELLCKPCNNIHYLELKYGPLPYKLIWESKDV